LTKNFKKNTALMQFSMFY